jgi:hypothetical protein
VQEILLSRRTEFWCEDQVITPSHREELAAEMYEFAGGDASQLYARLWEELPRRVTLRQEYRQQGSLLDYMEFRERGNGRFRASFPMAEDSNGEDLFALILRHRTA